MRRLILGFLLTILSGSAVAEWVAVASGDNMTVYADSTTIRRSGDIVRIWRLNDFKTARTLADKPYLSMKTLDEYDCKVKRSRTLAGSAAYNRNMAQGEVLHTATSNSNWASVAAGTVQEIVMKVACGKW